MHYSRTWRTRPVALVLVNDLARSRFSFLSVWFACRVLTRSRVVRFDGPASVRSAFTPQEAVALAERAGLYGAIVQRQVSQSLSARLGAQMTWDAVVIGAGPAGSVTARELARRGCRVLMVDKAKFPRTKVCGCCLNGAAIGTLERLGLGHVLEGAMPLDRVNLAAGSRVAELRLSRGVALSREVLDARLVEEAVRAGVEFRAGVMVNRVNDFLSYSRIVIVASGLTGGDANAVAGSRIGAAVVLAEEVAPEFYGSRTIYMATGRGGYVGLVRVEDDRLDVAAAFDAAFVKSAGGLGLAAEVILREVRLAGSVRARGRAMEGDAGAYAKVRATRVSRSVRCRRCGRVRRTVHRRGDGLGGDVGRCARADRRASSSPVGTTISPANGKRRTGVSSAAGNGFVASCRAFCGRRG